MMADVAAAGIEGMGLAAAGDPDTVGSAAASTADLDGDIHFTLRRPREGDPDTLRHAAVRE